MAPRLQLQTLFEELLESPNVYFQPPPSKQMEYPCIVYKRNFAESAFADNGLYRYTMGYVVTVIDQDPDSVIPDKVAALPMCKHNRFYTADNLNHDVFNLFF